MLFALLVQYHAAIPHIYKYKVAATAPSSTGGSSSSSPASIMQTGIFLTSKSLSYVIPCQLALSQLPGSALAALVGWAVGTAYRRDLLPYASQWRVPGWLVGEKRDDSAREGFEGFEGLRRRLEGEREAGAGQATGILAAQGQGAPRRRTLGMLIAEQFRGVGGGSGTSG